MHAILIIISLATYAYVASWQEAAALYFVLVSWQASRIKINRDRADKFVKSYAEYLKKKCQ